VQAVGALGVVLGWNFLAQAWDTHLDGIGETLRLALLGVLSLRNAL